MNTRFNNDVIDLLRAKSASDPNGVYATLGGGILSYAELDQRSNAFAVGMLSRGIGKGERLAVMTPNSFSAICHIFGMMKAGIVWVPVNTRQRGEGLRYILEHCEPSAILVHPEFLDTVNDALSHEGATPVIVTAENGDLPGGRHIDSDWQPIAHKGHDDLAIMYTSGTTGAPKGVRVSRAMLRYSAEAVILFTEIKSDERMLVWEPLFHIGGAQLLPLPLITGARLAMVDRFSASRFWNDVKEQQATHIHFLGGILQILLKQDPSPIERGHGARIAWGGGCPADIWREVEARFGLQIREGYGMTEASSVTSFNKAGLVGSVGKCVPWLDVTIRTEDGRVAAPGERGEITVEAKEAGVLFEGYFRNVEATAKALRGDVLNTGDSGSLDAQGNLYFHGRMTDSVRCRGENVSAWEVERVAQQHEAVEEAAMIGVKTDIGEQDIKLFLKLKPGHTLRYDDFSRWISPKLASYQNPRYLVLIDDFEKTPSLRIMKHKLPADITTAWDREFQRSINPERTRKRGVEVADRTD